MEPKRTALPLAAVEATDRAHDHPDHGMPRALEALTRWCALIACCAVPECSA